MNLERYNQATADDLANAQISLLGVCAGVLASLLGTDRRTSEQIRESVRTQFDEILKEYPQSSELTLEILRVYCRDLVLQFDRRAGLLPSREPFLEE